MKIGILCSGVALGVYIPAIYIFNDLKRRGVPAEVFVLENLMPEEKKNKINENKKAFHRNFSVALMGQKMAGDMMPNLALEKIADFFETCLRDQIHHFIVISGFLLPVLELFTSRFPKHGLFIECLHMDSDYSTSWKKVNCHADGCSNSWLFRYHDRRIVSELKITELSPVPFPQRLHRILVHGGGWGMGTYRSKIPELKAAEFDLDVVVYEPAEIDENQGNDRYYMVNPDWSPWLKNEFHEHQFPPSAQIVPGQDKVFQSNEQYHLLFEVTREAFAVVSKPGGSTLMETYAAATPLIFIDPFGEYEAKNAKLWETLGFGLYYDDWRKEGFRLDIIRKLYDNLFMAKDGKPDFVNQYLEKSIKGELDATQNNSKF